MSKSLKHFTLKGITELIKTGDLTPEQEQILFAALEVVENSNNYN